MHSDSAIKKLNVKNGLRRNCHF